MEFADKDSFASATNKTAAAETRETIHELRCARCAEPFEPRKHGGGKPQKYCGEKCRTAGYAEKQRRQIIRQDDSSSEAADGPAHDPRPRGPSSPRDDYDWKGAAVVVREQQAIAMYRDDTGNLVIRQERAWDEEYDSCIMINEHNAERFFVELSALMRTAGL